MKECFDFNRGARGTWRRVVTVAWALAACAPLRVTAAVVPTPPAAPPGARGALPGVPPPFPSTAQQRYTAAIYVADGKYVPASSVASTVNGGHVADTAASGVTIRSAARSFNGIVVRGKGTRYTLSNSTIVLRGNGSNDFLAFGAGALAEGGATLVLRNDHITTSGVAATAATASNHATLEVYDSVLRANGGRLPAGYKPFIGPGMLTPPAPLGITGTARATLTMDNSRSYYHHSTIISSGWGALSTDAANGHVYLEADDSLIRVLKSGYGTYADNGCEVVINRSRMNTATYTGIIAGPGTMRLDDVDATSGRNGVMVHDVMGSTADVGRLTITGGTLRSKQTVILVKSANAQILIDGARLVAGNGTLLESIVNPDPNATKVNGRTVFGIHAKLENVRLSGNILARDTARVLQVSLVHSRLTGEVEGATLALDRHSTWTATGNSTVTLLGPIRVDQLEAGHGVTIHAVAGPRDSLTGIHVLAGGGTLIVTGGRPDGNRT
jgi:hypothetical protein